MDSAAFKPHLSEKEFQNEEGGKDRSLLPLQSVINM
jgi:hypothetical protein